MSGSNRTPVSFSRDELDQIRDMLAKHTSLRGRNVGANWNLVECSMHVTLKQTYGL
jgi:hypothetical protein